MSTSSTDAYLKPKQGHTIDYRADRGSETDTPNDEVPAKWEAWKRQSEERELKYFIPDWDDLVDPRYDFENERYSNSTGPDDRGSGGWENEVFAHQLYDTPSYDGILVSREVLQKSKKKARAFKELANGNGGVHRYLRVPHDFPVMGDCGAFGYIDKEEPPYSVENVVEYYTDYGFNYGISVDHLVLGADDKEGRDRRYELTLENAKDFIDLHHQRGLNWKPMAAVQGWDVPSYVKAAKESVEMGYDYLAIGGLVRSSTKEVLLILRRIREAVGKDIDLHALGVARFATIQDFLDIGVTSMDSATYLRRAWTSRKDNYWTRDEKVYSAIRVPGPKRALRKMAKDQADAELDQKAERENGMDAEVVKEQRKESRAEAVEHTLDERFEAAEEMKEECFDGLRTYGRGQDDALSAEELVNLLDAYQAYVGRECLREHYLATLMARPWERCGCAICENVGIEAVIFSGNNRNRRRGFHNTRVFYDFLGEVLETRRSITIRRGVEVKPQLFKDKTL